jgi:hypothetical protein
MITMLKHPILKITLTLLTISSLLSCTSFKQNANEVMIRDPNIGKYSNPQPARKTATDQWQYAVLSENAYQKGKVRNEISTESNTPVPISTSENQNIACSDLNNRRLIPISGWTKWNFPSTDLQQEMQSQGLYLEVMERTTEPREIVVVFEGTNFTQLRDWKANFRWFLRFIPGYNDQYTIVAKNAAKEFHQIITSSPSKYQYDAILGKLLASADGTPIKIVAAGHSLGGGLAQHFAYTFVQQPPEYRGPKISEVYAFDTSPVTGWFSSPDPPRSYNAEGLIIHRIFEHGEVMAYLRLLTSRFASSSKNPEIWEYRYNFDPKLNIIRNHSMRNIACGMIHAIQD